MVKYSFEFKLKIIQEYIDGQVSCYALKVKYKISDTQIRRWVDSYLQKGIEGYTFKEVQGNPQDNSLIKLKQ